jgi:hypothetical protein
MKREGGREVVRRSIPAVAMDVKIIDQALAAAVCGCKIFFWIFSGAVNLLAIQTLPVK